MKITTNLNYRYKNNVYINLFMTKNNQAIAKKQYIKVAVISNEESKRRVFSFYLLIAKAHTHTYYVPINITR